MFVVESKFIKVSYVIVLDIRERQRQRERESGGTYGIGAIPKPTRH